MAARSWLASHGIPSTATDGVYFEDKRAEKLFRIKQLGCTDFIDDLPEFLTETQFPLGVQRLLFDPANGPASQRNGLWKTALGNTKVNG